MAAALFDSDGSSLLLLQPFNSKMFQIIHYLIPIRSNFIAHTALLTERTAAAAAAALFDSEASCLLRPDNNIANISSGSLPSRRWLYSMAMNYQLVLCHISNKLQLGKTRVHITLWSLSRSTKDVEQQQHQKQEIQAEEAEWETGTCLPTQVLRLLCFAFWSISFLVFFFTFLILVNLICH